jgi:nicotinate-nucleotide--dimethylbenzimidazole phosphoribosyltransferase
MAAILTDTLRCGADRCDACGAPFDCAMNDPRGCWCAGLPPLVRVVPGAGCLCPACLRLGIERERARDAAGVAPLAPLADPALDERIAAAWRAKTMPAGALGALQALGTRLARIAGRAAPRVGPTAIVVFAGDHGLAAEGVSAYPPEVTAQMVRNFGEGGAAISVLCRVHDVALIVVDAGTLTPQAPGFAPAGSRFIDARIAPGTGNPLHGPAMSDAQMLEAIARGAAIVRGLDADAVGLGEMGIGNSSAAALLTARLLQAPLEDCVGRGTGLDDTRLAHKCDVLARCLAAHPDAYSPLAALAAFGGFETAMLVGAMLACAAARRPIVVDGFIVGAAALVAARIDPAVLECCVFAHRSSEPGHAPLLAALGAEPLLDLGLRLGEGSGAALAMPMLRAAAALLADMATFEAAGVSDRAAR